MVAELCWNFSVVMFYYVLNSLNCFTVARVFVVYPQKQCELRKVFEWNIDLCVANYKIRYPEIEVYWERIIHNEGCGCNIYIKRI